MSVSSLQKVQRSLSLIAIIQKGICRQTSMEEFKLENNNFGTFCACSRKLKCFFFSSIMLFNSEG